MDLTEFISTSQRTIRQKSVLAPFLQDLLELREKGFTLTETQNYLKTHSINVSTQLISKYINKSIKTSSPSILVEKKTVNTFLPTSIKSLAENTIPLNFPPRSNSPADLTRIMSAPVDINKLKKAAREAEAAEKSKNNTL